MRQLLFAVIRICCVLITVLLSIELVRTWGSEPVVRSLIKIVVVFGWALLSYRVATKKYKWVQKLVGKE